MTSDSVKDVLRVLDRRETSRDQGLKQTAESIAVFAQDESKTPCVVEYTRLAGSFGRLCAETTRVVVCPLDRPTREWLLEGKEDAKVKDTLYVTDSESRVFAFAQQPWKTVLLRDCLWYMKNDAELTEFLTELAKTITPATDVVFALDKPGPIGSTNEEIDGVIITRKIASFKPRVMRRITRLRSLDQGATLDEELMTWAASDVFACARETGYAPAKGLFGFDPTRFVIYRLKG